MSDAYEVDDEGSTAVYLMKTVSHDRSGQPPPTDPIAPAPGCRRPWPRPRKPVLPGTHPDYPVKNLALEGGGARGLAYCGAILALEQLGRSDGQPGVLDFVSRFAGASAGSLVAMSLALGYSAAEVDQMSADADMDKELKDGSLCCGVLRMLCCGGKRLGIYPGDRLLGWIGDAVAARTGDPLTTFKELYDETGVELCVVVCNLTCMTTEEWHVKTTPNK